MTLLASVKLLTIILQLSITFFLIVMMMISPRRCLVQFKLCSHTVHCVLRTHHTIEPKKQPALMTDPLFPIFSWFDCWINNLIIPSHWVSIWVFKDFICQFSIIDDTKRIAFFASEYLANSKRTLQKCDDSCNLDNYRHIFKLSYLANLLDFSINIQFKAP